MERPGLYFPFIHIRDESWLKSAALYFPSVRRLVPHGYLKHDTPTAKAFFDAEILQDEDPQRWIDGATWNLLRTLKANTRLLSRHYSVRQAQKTWTGEVWGEGAEDGRTGALGWIHVTKFQPEVLNYLADRGLAMLGRSDSRWNLEQPGDPWVGLHPVLAGAYMTALATRVSEDEFFHPMTDQLDLRVATPNSDVQAALRLLLGRREASPRKRDFATEGVNTYIMLAMQYARPRNLDGIAAEKIIQCRTDLKEELVTFRRYVDSQQEELAELAAIPVKERRLEEFARHVEQTIEMPLQKLERGLRLFKLEPVRSLVLTSSFAAPVIAEPILHSFGATPREGLATGVAAAIGTAWWSVRENRADVRESSPVAYLLDVNDALTPLTLSGGISKFLRGTYRGRTTTEDRSVST